MCVRILVTDLSCTLQFETPEDYKNDMGISDLDPSSPPAGTSRSGFDPEAVPEVVFDTGKERRTKTAMQSGFPSPPLETPEQRKAKEKQLAIEQQQQRERQLAADAVMKQLLGKRCASLSHLYSSRAGKNLVCQTYLFRVCNTWLAQQYQMQSQGWHRQFVLPVAQQLVSQW